MALSSHFPLQRTLHSSRQLSFIVKFALFVCLYQMAAGQGIESPKKAIEFPAAPSFFSSKKWIKLIPKCQWQCHDIQWSWFFCPFLHSEKVATAHARVADITPWQVGQPCEQLHQPSWVQKMSFSSSNCGRHIFSHTKWLPKITDYRDTATNGNRKKRLCVRLRWEDKHHLRKSADRKAQIRKAFVPITGLIKSNFVLFCLQIFSYRFSPFNWCEYQHSPARPKETHSSRPELE